MANSPALTRRSVLQLAGITAVAACDRTSARPVASPSISPPVPAGSASAAKAPSLAELSSLLSSPLLRPGSQAYAASVGLYNPRFDSSPRPVAIASCATPADVVACVRFAAQGGAPIHLRAGGHSYGGWSSGTGLVADVRPMSSVHVDASSRTVRIGAGARLAQVYEGLGRSGAAIAAGSCPSVGITGLALGGGVGVLTRVFGLTCDAIRAVQVVTADGILRDVDAQHEPDLFWALRGGGGGSFAAVTALTLATRPAPTVHTFFLSWEGSRAAEVLAAWQSWIGGRDQQLWSTCKLLGTPSNGETRAVVAGTWLGGAAELDTQLAPLLRAVGASPRTRGTRTLGYAQAMQLEAGCTAQDARQCLATALGPDARLPFAATSAVLRKPLPAEGITVAVTGARRALDAAGLVEGGLSFDALGGAVDAVAPSDTAFVHRGALATVQYTATWKRPADDTARYDAYVRSQRAGLLPWTGPAAYANYADASIRDYGAAYWGANYPRLREIKKRYDGSDLFTFPQAVRAAS